MIALLATIPSPSRNVIEIGPFTVHFYGIMIAIGVIAAVIVTKRRYVRFGGSGELVERVAIWAVVVGFLGARLGYVITHTGDFLWDRPWGILYIWEGGLALYGGLIAGALAAIYLLNRWHGDVFAFGDSAAVGIPLAQAIGRIGNYFNQELYGKPTDLPWGLEIDPENRLPGWEQFETFQPTFLYEALGNLLIVIPTILILERKGKLFKGAAFPLYVMLYGTLRFVMELLRTDTTFRFLGMSRNGWISLGAVIGATVVFIWMQRRRQPQGVDPESQADIGEQNDDAPDTEEPEEAELRDE
jgi:prolipoprotein diacylglyceryl transferase